MGATEGLISYKMPSFKYSEMYITKILTLYSRIA